MNAARGRTNLFFCRKIGGACVRPENGVGPGSWPISIWAAIPNFLQCSRVGPSPSLQCLFPISHIHPKSYSAQPGPPRPNPWVFCILSIKHSCQNSSPLRPTRPPLRQSAHLQRMLSGRQTRVIQVSLCVPLTQDRGVYCILIPSRCSDGDGPCHPRPLHPVSICHRAWRFRFIGQFATRFFNANPKSSKWFNRDRFVLSNGYVLVSRSGRMSDSECFSDTHTVMRKCT